MTTRLKDLKEQERRLLFIIEQQYVAWGRANVVRKPVIKKRIEEYEQERRDLLLQIRDAEEKS